HYISQAAVDGALDNDKLVQVLQAQEDGMRQLFTNQESDGLDDLMKELDSETAPIREVNMGMKADTELDNLEKELQKQADDGMKNVDRLLNSEM
ncbi:MAG: hypothetical protein Q4C70_04655, partial [Planctomycetia bacterium]|nr:hypothetical protein [Planctomycetia bacterium]